MLLVKCGTSEGVRVAARMQLGRPCRVVHAVSAVPSAHGDRWILPYVSALSLPCDRRPRL
eukprot:4928969-Prymnesium_polylepis.1